MVSIHIHDYHQFWHGPRPCCLGFVFGSVNALLWRNKNNVKSPAVQLSIPKKVEDSFTGRHNMYCQIRKPRLMVKRSRIVGSIISISFLMFKSWYVPIYTSKKIYIYIYISISVYIYIYMYVCIHVYIHIYILNLLIWWLYESIS